MVLSPLGQLLVVAVLAYGAGLFLGLSFYRGEIGPGRRAMARPSAAAAVASAAGDDGQPRRRRRRKQKTFQERLGERTRQAVVLLFMLAFITVLGMGFYSVMGAGAEVLKGRAYAGSTQAASRGDGRSPDGR